MCLIAFALGMSSRWPLVIAANRDEYWARPTAPLALWKTGAGHSVLSGRDLRAGGTWMGTSPKGRVAFLTNVRAPETLVASQLTSRGSLVTRWLAGFDETPEHLVAALQDELRSTGLAYAGFNLVVGDAMRGQWHWISNRPGGSLPQISQAAPADIVVWSIQELPPGLYGFVQCVAEHTLAQNDAPESCVVRSFGARRQCRCAEGKALAGSGRQNALRTRRVAEHWRAAGGRTGTVQRLRRFSRVGLWHAQQCRVACHGRQRFVRPLAVCR